MRQIWTRNAGFAAVMAAFLAAGCTTQAPAPQPIAAPDPSIPTLEQATGPAECTRPINEYQRILAADVGTGSLDRSVFPRVAADLGPVRQACAAGQVQQALQQLQATKHKYGYR